MAFIDEIKITAKAGKGGDGVVRWRHEKFINKGGPAGGDGGRGGDVYAKAVRDIHILSKHKSKKEFVAKDGGPGGSKSLHGANGDNMIVELPRGSIITNTLTGEKYSLEKEGQEILLLSGGRGGFGNEHFKRSTNTTPKEWTPGKPAEEGEFLIELELYADIGFVGLPNAGKSSLLNVLTNADAKVGDYAFTTLDPNLGDFYGYILADIPGLIEGASEGKGLGTKFLRHIKRTKMLAHLVSFENELVRTGGMMKTYKEIRKELEKYDKKNKLDEEGLSSKEEIIILTKTDVVEDAKIITKKKKDFEKTGKKVFVLSLYDDKSVKEFKKELTKILEGK